MNNKPNQPVQPIQRSVTGRTDTRRAPVLEFVDL
jgi:hypothetical protein